MRSKQRILTGLGLGFIALAMALGLALGYGSNSTVQAAPAAQATPNANATPGTNTTPSTQANPRPEATLLTQLKDAFVKAFAARLGIDEAKLNAAFTGAVNDTADQAVKDGKLTQDQANHIKDVSKNGAGGFGFGGPGFHLGGPGPRGGNGMLGPKGVGGPDLEEAAKVLGVTSAELKTQLQAGKSIATIAKDKNVDLKKVKDALLASAKTRLDEAVKNGKMTQAQADQAYQNAGTQLDNFLNNTGFMGGRRGR